MSTKIQKAFTVLAGFNFRKKPGSAQWLIDKEIQYGGMHTNVPRNKVSPLDPRTGAEIVTGGMTGGDRMHHHGYAKYYEKYLRSFVRTGTPLTLIEVGILKGVGLAIWCDLFPNSGIIGFDIDIEHFLENRGVIEAQGGFKKNLPEIYEFDQFVDNSNLVGQILGEKKIDVLIDDGFHSIDSIIATLNSFRDYLAENFVYFIEDNAEVGVFLESRFPEYKVYLHGELTVMTRRV